MASALLGSADRRLPTELVLLIVEYVADDNYSLCRLAQTCRAMQHLAEEHIYKTIQLLTVRHLDDIIYALAQRRERVRAVHKLSLQYQYHEEDLELALEDRSAFNECISQMVNLREWHIESPYDNCHWDDDSGPDEWVQNDMEAFQLQLQHACKYGQEDAERVQALRGLGYEADRLVGLASLESLTIHSHGISSDFWDLGNFDCLFRHPALRHLHISCVSLIEEIPSLQSHTSKTPLTTLVFDECEISPEALKDVLRVPAKLKHLTLGENVWNTRVSKTCKPRLNRDVKVSMAALGQVAHSLETLTHRDPSWKLDPESHKARRMNPPGEGMRNYHALKYLQCETNSFLHQAIIMNHEVAPPNLETLRLARHWDETVDFFERPPEIETYLALPALTTLELMQASAPRKETSDENYICDAERVRNRHAYAFKLHKVGINLKVLIEMHKERLIPPYLHGETQPVTACLYNANDVGFKHNYTEAMVTAAARDMPESDRFSDSDIHHHKLENRHALTKLKESFIRRGRLYNAGSLAFGDDVDEYDPFAVEIDHGGAHDVDFDDIDMDHDDLDDDEDYEDEDEEMGDVDVPDDLD
ncbi:hypothetical protein BDU57DRAFT_443226 [Ampelomyces quisqualis]|uniref:F-box domain-containing protein n=1 Tax=Ampelomyces quisqualis TaxID=50730 RepID=A0A6A5QXN8_AMPQU|nr:hypothetical protein BDU57DRAFT_443226 [Ampelomyces quisqualis]